ncbi:DUF2786 domain-containing protein [Nocardia farcinica]|uniref:DUF2786 domain-containing protein n=1 Tax=Nocardia farcinica TaxID=37329 RepID=UPI000A3CB566|nr:DUF2786 domain-containing protein [Nocardia farcinica]MBF6140620.1 DUF2786 domain-containing protein [Nocardia farcinica]MBF6255148.1 DUF2786 domain-containing protein [Nocardia farcinica]MBF6264954.1 DUF2786 domain-containing protein [Nocardia farcinica]MBF6268951.1 DUF2786 domain-containing protein [Nocardia farcinica]MBF6282813.1 DUF2786 domain-containing protein [Nocardia farcinica]
MSSPNPVPDRMLTRIGGLLRKAEATDNEHEAEAFLAAAQRLATRSSIDLAVARAHVAGRERRPTPVQRVIPIGEPGRKGLRTYVQLFVAIAHANDVRCDVARTSTQVYAYGFDTDIDTCEALYTSLLVQMVRASDHYIKSGAYREATVEKVVTEQRWGRTVRRRVQAPAAPVTARLNFQMAFAERIGRRLAEVKSEVEAEAVAEPAAATGTALALRNKEVELVDFYTRTSEARGTWRGPQASAGRSAAARRAGDRAGRAARLGPAPELGGVRGQLGPGERA